MFTKKNINVGSQIYPNCHLIKKYKSFEGKSENIRDLSEKIIVLPTHKKVDQKYTDQLIYEIKKNY